MKLSVVIVNYNVKYFLEQCLHSVDDAIRGVNAEVIVVDNNSVDGSAEMVAEKFPNVKLIANTENTGFSKANNQAIRQCSGEYILLLNPDTVVEHDTLTKSVAFMDSHPDAGGLGIKMVDGKGRFLPESKRGLPTPVVAFYKIFGLSALFPKSKIFGQYHLGYLDKEETHVVDVLAGAYMMLRRETLDKTGLLDETFFMYGEDLDWAFRIKKAGWKVFYHPAVTVRHVKRAASRRSRKAQFEFHRASLIFYRKHYRATTPLPLHLMVLAGLLMKGGRPLLPELLHASPSTG